MIQAALNQQVAEQSSLSYRGSEVRAASPQQSPVLSNSLEGFPSLESHLKATQNAISGAAISQVNGMVSFIPEDLETFVSEIMNAMSKLIGWQKAPAVALAAITKYAIQVYTQVSQRSQNRNHTIQSKIRSNSERLPNQTPNIKDP